jgi:glycosyltransferase involved in cell wall biosynthesis
VGHQAFEPSAKGTLDRPESGILIRMKVALVHELLTMRGGAEKVLRILAAMYPDAPIYTLLYNQRALGDWFPRERVRTSTIKPWRGMNHHLYLSQFPSAAEAWAFDEFDLVISTSSAFVHGIITNGNPKHLCYVHSPARYLWDRTHDVIERASGGLFGLLKRRYLEKKFHALRIWDSEAADRPDTLLAASKEVQRRIEQYWRRKSEVVYPPIDDVWLSGSTPRSPKSESRSPYYLIVSTLASYKRIDLAIHACNQTKHRLIIAGQGPALASLRAIAGPTIEFVGYKSDNELRNLYAHAEATIVPGEEDFGLVPLESMACGTPVIAYRAGGPLETIQDRVTGLFFDEPTPASLAAALTAFKKNVFDTKVCVSAAQFFSRTRFEEQIRAAAESLVNSAH